MKIVVFSDIHGNLEGLLEFKRRLNIIQYDKVLFLGDVFGYYYEQSDVLKELHKVKDLIWLKGNHDKYFLNSIDNRGLLEGYVERYGHSYQLALNTIGNAEVEFIKTLPSMATFSTDNVSFGAFHGTPVDSLEGRLYPDKEVVDEDIPRYEKYDVVFLGHTHCRMKKYAGKTLIINPGSVGQPRDGKGHSFAVFDTTNMQVEFVEYRMDYSNLYKQIDKNDIELSKLKEVLERTPK